MPAPELTFPDQLLSLHARVVAQREALYQTACWYADALERGGVVHVYANGHSRMAVEEMVIRMGALTGFHAMLQAGLTSFTDVVGASGIRLNQTLEKVEGLGAKLLDECDVASGEPLVVVTATGTTAAAVDIALEWVRRYPENPLIGICSRAQSESAATKHSAKVNLHQVIAKAKHGILLDNGMPIGDTTLLIQGTTGEYPVCPLSSIGALTLVQSLNELTIRELDRRGVAHHVLRNMHLNDTRDTYNAWIRDQRTRYARVLENPNAIVPKK
jgi:uncharacterized phosphosugar-binding protein